MPPKKKLKPENTTEEQISSTTPTNREVLGKLIEGINKSFKSNIISFGDEYDAAFLLRRPTGILSLDIAIQGGLPRGITEIAGETNVGKTQLSVEICKQIQKNYGPESCIALCMVEPWDKSFWKNLGFKVAFSDEEISLGERALKRKYTPEEYAYLKEQVGEVVHAKCLNAEDMLETALKCIESGIFQVVVIDSVGSMMSEQQDQKDFGEKTYGGNSTAIQEFVNRFTQLKTNTTVIMINQVRDNMNRTSPYAEEFRVLGGNALKHGKFVSIWLSKGGKIKKEVKIAGKATEVEVGRSNHWLIKKQKCGGPDGERGQYDFYKGKFGYSLGIDIWTDLVRTGVYYDVINRAGAWYSYGEEKIGQGEENAGEFLKNRPELAEEIKMKCFEAAGVNFVVRE